MEVGNAGITGAEPRKGKGPCRPPEKSIHKCSAHLKGQKPNVQKIHRNEKTVKVIERTGY